MPLVYQQNINEFTRMAVWRLSETEDFFLRVVPLQKEVTHPHKRLQHLAGRYLLKELYTDFPLELIQVADTRKPFLCGEAYHFSISHCEAYAAAIVSSVNRVGADIEIVSDKAERIKNKFLTDYEQLLVHEILNKESSLLHVQVITLCWSIKETMFKWYGLGKIDFKRNLRIEKLELKADEFTAHCIFYKEMQIPVIVRGLMFNGNILTWTVS